MHNAKRIFLIGLVLASAFHWSLGQPVYFRHYQIEDGLANNTVFSLFQDSRGFMWMGTKEGLNRFDGTTFKAFDMKLDNDPEVKEFVFSIDEGSQGTLWVGTRKGLYAFDPRTEHFTLIPHTRDHEILKIRSDGRDKVWFIADLDLYCYDEATRETRPIDLAPGQITALASGPEGSIWVGAVGGSLFHFDADRHRFDCINCTVHDEKARPREVTHIYPLPDGQLLIGTMHGLTRYAPHTGHYYALLGKEAHGAAVYVRDILPFSNRAYWVASESGIHQIDVWSGERTEMRHRDSDPYSISDNAVYALFRDREGGIWCGTYFGGVNYYHPSHATFKKYFRTDDPQSLSGNAIRELCPDSRGNLWVGTEDAGLNRLDLRTGEVTHFPAPASVSSTNIHALLLDGDELWVGTFQQGLDVLDVRTGRRKRHYHAGQNGKGLRSNFIISSCRTQSGELLFGTSRGIHRYRRSADTFELAPGFPATSYVFCLYEDRSGVLWAGTIGTGLYSYNPRNGQTGHYLADSRNESGLSSNSVCGIFEDSYGNLWVSTEGGGLCQLDRERKHFTRHNTATGMPSDMVYAVLEDQQQQLWVSTSRGLTCYSSASGRWKTFTTAHGLLTDQFNYSSAYRDTSGTLYFGSVKGLVSFQPSQLEAEAADPPVYITSFQVHHQELPVAGPQLLHAIAFTDTVRLRYDQSSIAIGFSALTYTAPAMTPYLYRMEGVDNDWTYLPTNRKVYFTGLAPGDYLFRARTAGSSAANEQTLLIRVAPPWWLSPWAYLAYAVALSGLIYRLVSAYRRRQHEKHRRRLAYLEQEKEKEIYKAKIEFFTHVAHEIRTPLTLIRGPLEMVMDEADGQETLQKNLRSIERNTERLVTLTDQLLDFRKTESQGYSLNFVKVNVPQCLEDLCRPFSAAAAQRGVALHIDMPARNFHAFVDWEAFRKIVDNLIGNAVKYAERQITVRLRAPSRAHTASFRIEVSNDGPAIPPALSEKIFEPFFRIGAVQQPGSGIGLSLARSLANLHHGTLELAPAGDCVNTFVLVLPKHQEIEFDLSTFKKKSS